MNTGSATARPATVRGEDGYSLIEVLAAAALLLGVLLAIMGMFVYGGRSVNSGKLMTRATTVATDVLEEFRRLSFAQTYQILVEGDADFDESTEHTATWNSISGGPEAPTDASYDAILDTWKATVEDTLPGGEITVTVRGLQSLGTGSAEPPAAILTQARVLQVVVSVKWQQAKRPRSVVFETFRS